MHGDVANVVCVSKGFVVCERRSLRASPCPVGSTNEEKLWWETGELWREACEKPAGWGYPWSSLAVLRR